MQSTPSKQLRRSKNIENWYVIDGSFAQPEGTANEWYAVITAIREKRSCQPASRVAVTTYDDGRIKFYSPRNCNHPDDAVRLDPEEVESWLMSAEKLLTEDGFVPTTDCSDKNSKLPKQKGKLSRFIDSFLGWSNDNTDPVEKRWLERNVRITRVLFEWDDGTVRELTGKAADEWWHDLYRAICGRSVNWQRHSFKETHTRSAT